MKSLIIYSFLIVFVNVVACVLAQTIYPDAEELTATTMASQQIETTVAPSTAKSQNIPISEKSLTHSIIRLALRNALKTTKDAMKLSDHYDDEESAYTLKIVYDVLDTAQGIFKIAAN